MNKKHHEIKDIFFTDNSLQLNVDGLNHKFKFSDISKRLANASVIERNKYEISPSGYGIHWPLLDEDLSIDGLLGIKHQPKKTTKAMV